ncbi:hypothetical protein ABBQ38_005496 [Trebouxia sp. C0009 RCD-2024]
MRRSNSFPGAVLNDIAANKLTSSLTAQFESPAVLVGPSSSASSGDLDSESFADDWNADEVTTPSRGAQPVDIHAMTAAVLLEKFLGPLQNQSQDDLISADGSLRRADVSQRSNHTWHGATTANDHAGRGLAQRASQPLRQTRAGSSQQTWQSRAAANLQSRLDLHRRSFSRYGTEAADLVRRFIEGPPGVILEEQFACKARLVLHFDINKTIIMTDKAQGSGLDQMINMLLSECAWGRLEPGPLWVPVGRLATDRPASDPQLMSYRIFLDSFLLPIKVGKGAALEALNTAIKAERQKLKRVFTEAGQPGDMFRGVFEKLREKLMRAPTTGCQHRILPSFFELLKHLQSQGRDFTIVFRSFGDDISEVVEEMNAFATGQHPSYPEVRMDGSDGHTDLRMSMPDNVGAFYRSSTKSDGSALCLGASQMVMTAKQLSLQELEACAAQSGRKLLTTFPEMRLAFLHECGKRRINRAFALRDYYPFWKTNAERSQAGKLLLLSRRDEEHIQIMFDDNIGYGSPHIVDARDAETGQSVSFKEVNGKHLLKAEPLNAILDPQYFVRQVHECVMRVLRDRMAKEQHSADQAALYRSQPRQLYGKFPNAHAAPEGGATKPIAVANTSTRAKFLWGLVSQRLLGAIRVRRAMQGT